MCVSVHNDDTRVSFAKFNTGARTQQSGNYRGGVLNALLGVLRPIFVCDDTSLAGVHTCLLLMSHDLDLKIYQIGDELHCFSNNSFM